MNKEQFFFFGVSTLHPPSFLSFFQFLDKNWKGKLGKEILYKNFILFIVDFKTCKYFSVVFSVMSLIVISFF